MPRKRIRLLTPRPAPPPFSVRLEQDARRIVRSANGSSRGWSPERQLLDEVAQLLDQLDRARQLHARLIADIDRESWALRQEHRRITPKTEWYYDHRWGDRQQLERRIATLSGERRRLVLIHDERMQHLHRQLLTAVQRFRQVQGGTL